MDQVALFNYFRGIDGSISQLQVDSLQAILEACTKYGVTDSRQIAYIIPTTFHESDLKPNEEAGKGRGYPYGQMLDIGSGPGKRVPYTAPNQIYYGRGFVQLTWLCNYRAFSKLLGVDLVNNPGLALQVDYAAEILVVGMQKGMFTGHTLNQFFNATKTDPVEAREIVNGLDCAVLIESYYNNIIKTL